jgi:cardiolipin synthase
VAWITDQVLAVLGVVLIVAEILGVLTAVRAVQTTRTPQGAIAWTFALLSWPIFAVPLFWVFGRSKFEGSVSTRRSRDQSVLGITEDARARVDPCTVDLGEGWPEGHVLERLVHMPFLEGNRLRLLVDGKATFDAIFSAIAETREYVLVQFYIVNDDDLGGQLKALLIAQAAKGRRVYFLYDEVGSGKMTRKYLAELKRGGVHVTAMNTTRGWRNRFQLNFRNHRKIVVVDGQRAFVGGHNVGDEYVDGHRKLTPWRDTHMEITGPGALALQLIFLEDWHWAAQSVPEVQWQPLVQPENKTVFLLPSGPDDELETCGLFFTHAINTARKRIWIASPYFIPDEGILNALELAVMRGVEVRVLIPGMSDNRVVTAAGLTYVQQVVNSGVALYEHHPGFMHQKVMLIDDHIATIGTANFDNRSFRLNFEISALTYDQDFATEVREMLEHDFASARRLDADELSKRPASARFGARVARLFSPIL